MDLAVVATVFALVAVAELPDKTMIATLVLGSRSRPLYVWIGGSAAFLVQVTLAIAAGRLLELLPHQALEAIVTALFLGGAAYLLLVPEQEAVAAGTRGADVGPVDLPAPWRTAWTAFGVILVGEFGDLTQLLTVNLAARYHRPLSVFAGAALALVSVCGLAAVSGRALLRVVPLQLVRRVGGAVLLGFAAYSIYALVS